MCLCQRTDSIVVTLQSENLHKYTRRTLCLRSLSQLTKHWHGFFGLLQEDCLLPEVERGLSSWKGLPQSASSSLLLRLYFPALLRLIGEEPFNSRNQLSLIIGGASLFRILLTSVIWDAIFRISREDVTWSSLGTCYP